MAALRPHVLSIGGSGRSGSTLVGRVLGESDAAICVGETQYLWTRALRDGVRCGCGEQFAACDFWTEVGALAFGGWGRLDLEACIATDGLTNRFRHLPRQRLAGRGSGSFATAVKDHTARLRRLYAAIMLVSGARVIVETSKDPSFVSLLTLIPASDVRIVHLVRDSRAVAHSWTRTALMPSPIAGEHFMPRFSPRVTAVNWLASNAAFHALARLHRDYRRIVYEDFVTRPRAVLAELSDFAGETLAPPASKLGESSVCLGEHHIFSGNPMRESSGWVDIAPDVAWRRDMSSRAIAEVTAITWPLLRAYGYPIAVARGGER